MPATATVTPAAPAPSWLAAPAGDWKTLSDAMTAEVPAIAGCPVPVACAPGAGLGSPACYLRDIPVIEVDGDLLEPDPDDCDPAIPGDRERYPVLWGALVHECAHAAHSQVRLPGERARELVHRRPPAGRVPHRVPPGRPPPRRPPLPARQRHQAGPRRLHRRRRRALQPPRGRRRRRPPARPRGRRHPRARRDRPGHRQGRGRDRHRGLGRLRATWREFHEIADDDLRTRVTLARRWCRILGLDPDAAPPAPLVIKIPSELAKALARAIEILAEAVAADFAPPPPPFPPDAADKREHEKASRRNAERAAREVFGRRTRPRAITGTRDPRDDEAAAARRLTRALREATAGGRDKVTVTSKVPPGRLRMGKALAGQAQRAAGAVPTAEPFTSTRSRRVPAPPLRVGIACDISGSMGAFAGPVASAAWILARAAGHLPSAITASVLFGKGVYALTRPGETPAKVTDFTATASSESACRAIDALDGALGLASPGTARLLVIVSDTCSSPPASPPGPSSASPACTAPAAASSSSPPEAGPASASTPTARSSRPATPPTPSTPSPAPPPAPSPPDTRPRGRAARPAPGPRERS